MKWVSQRNQSKCRAMAQVIFGSVTFQSLVSLPILNCDRSTQIVKENVNFFIFLDKTTFVSCPLTRGIPAGTEQKKFSLGGLPYEIFFRGREGAGV